jgi:DnaJ-class molecular chaperone
MQAPHTCPECKGSGCAPQPLQAPDDSLFLFPRCECCKGKGRLSDAERTAYLKRREKS